MKLAFAVSVATFLFAGLAGCATSLTVDDGRQLNPKLLSDIKAYADAAKAIRPAIVRSAAVNDIGCDTQYELPFDVMTSYGIDDADSKVALLRVLGVNEKLRVIAADSSAGMNAGDIITQVNGYDGRNSLKMVDMLTDARDDGRSISIKLASGRRVIVFPFRVCRGHVVIASPFDPAVQLYHWTQSVHPLEIFHQELSEDEAEWIVLWTQGLSERGGARMKTYAFLVDSIKWIATLGLGAATSGATASVRGAGAAGASTGGQVAAVQLAGQAASMATRAAANRASLRGVSGVAGGVFDKADDWAYRNIQKLGMNPRAGLTLHQKMIAQGAAANAFLYDDDRLDEMLTLLESKAQ
ncbi:MAG: hypothetical protein ACXWC4_09170 [Telluria sp.]